MTEFDLVIRRFRYCGVDWAARRKAEIMGITSVGWVVEENHRTAVVTNGSAVPSSI